MAQITGGELQPVIDGLMAAKQAQAATVAMARPPRKCPSHLCTAR